MNLLLDECMSPRLPLPLANFGIFAVHIRDRGMLGCDDYKVWKYAQEHNYALCTVNGRDFVRFARKSPHAGLLVFPHGGSLERQINWTTGVVSYALGSNSGMGFQNRYIEVDEDGVICKFEDHDYGSLH